MVFPLPFPLGSFLTPYTPNSRPSFSLSLENKQKRLKRKNKLE